MPPSVASNMRWAKRSAETPMPGKLFGQVVTIFSLRLALITVAEPWLALLLSPLPHAAKSPVVAIAPAPIINLRRLVLSCDFLFLLIITPDAPKPSER